MAPAGEMWSVVTGSPSLTRTRAPLMSLKGEWWVPMPGLIRARLGPCSVEFERQDLPAAPRCNGESAASLMDGPHPSRHERDRARSAKRRGPRDELWCERDVA